MPKRPVFHADIGQELAKIRDGYGWSQRQAIDMARRRGIALGLGPLRFLELGQTKHPDADLLRAVAKLYKLSFAELTKRFTEANYGVSFDLPRHGAEQQSGGPADGGLYDTAAVGVELQQLRERIAQYEKEASEVRTVTDALGKITLRLEEIRKAPSGTSARRRRDRKVG